MVSRDFSCTVCGERVDEPLPGCKSRCECGTVYVGDIQGVWIKKRGSNNE